MRSGDPAQRARVRCPNCRANNFLGQSECWQCHALLSGSAPLTATPIPVANNNKPQVMLFRLIFLAAIAVIVGLVSVIVYFVAKPSPDNRPAIRSQVSAPARNAFTPVRAPESGPPNPAPSTLNAQSTDPAPANPSVNAPTQTPARPDASADSDPTIAQAKREVERAKSNLNLPANAIGSDGLAHLQGGGTMTREQWEAARRKLQENSNPANAPATSP